MAQHEDSSAPQSWRPAPDPAAPGLAPGPLVVSTANPRYFTVASATLGGAANGGQAPDERAVYLAGSHIWNNFHDGMGPGADCADAPERLDYDAYLKFLKEHGHNFIRLWRWEQFRSQAAGGAFHLCMTPQPWPRTGPGAATDGGPKFDLATFDPAYFDRLRARVSAAGAEGIYVAVMLFDGWALHLSPAPANVEGHRFTPPTTSTASASPRSAITRSSRSTNGSGPCRKRTSARSPIRCTTYPTFSTRSPTNRRAAGRSTSSSPSRWAWERARRPTGVIPLRGNTG